MDEIKVFKEPNTGPACVSRHCINGNPEQEGVIGEGWWEGFASFSLIKSRRRSFPQVDKESRETAPEAACPRGQLFSNPPHTYPLCGSISAPQFWILPGPKATVPPSITPLQPRHHGHLTLGACDGWSGSDVDAGEGERSPAHCHQPSPPSGLRACSAGCGLELLLPLVCPQPSGAPTAAHTLTHSLAGRC